MKIELKSITVDDVEFEITAELTITDKTDDKLIKLSDIMFENFKDNDVFVSSSCDIVYVDVDSNSITKEEFENKLKEVLLKLNEEN